MKPYEIIVRCPSADELKCNKGHRDIRCVHATPHTLERCVRTGKVTGIRFCHSCVIVKEYIKEVKKGRKLLL